MYPNITYSPKNMTLSRHYLFWYYLLTCIFRLHAAAGSFITFVVVAWWILNFSWFSTFLRPSTVGQSLVKYHILSFMVWVGLYHESHRCSRCSLWAKTFLVLLLYCHKHNPCYVIIFCVKKLSYSSNLKKLILFRSTWTNYLLDLPM